MTELKTLKDIAKEHSEETGIDENQVLLDQDRIKAEAVKWVKALRSPTGKFNSIQGDFILMDFFNLTEDDLK
jgi:hypothetical protein